MYVLTQSANAWFVKKLYDKIIKNIILELI